MSDNTEFKVGDHVSFSMGSDTYPATVIRVTPCRVVIRCDEFAGDFANGHNYYGSQKWLFTENPNGSEHLFTRRGTVAEGHGRFAMKGGNYSWLRHGWSARQDPCF
jgi:hypothetical protein